MTDPPGAPAGDPRGGQTRGAQEPGEAAAPASLPPEEARPAVPVKLADLRRATVAYLSMLSETAAVIVAMGPDAEALRSEILAALDPSAPGALRIARELAALLGLANCGSAPVATALRWATIGGAEEPARMAADSTAVMTRVSATTPTTIAVNRAVVVICASSLAARARHCLVSSGPRSAALLTLCRGRSARARFACSLTNTGASMSRR